MPELDDGWKLLYTCTESTKSTVVSPKLASCVTKTKGVHVKTLRAGVRYIRTSILA